MVYQYKNGYYGSESLISMPTRDCTGLRNVVHGNLSLIPNDKFSLKVSLHGNMRLISMVISKVTGCCCGYRYTCDGRQW